MPGTAKRILPHPTLLIRTWPSTTVAIGRPFIFHPWYGQLRLLLRRRRRVLRSNANLVEIDLLRGGEPMPMNGVPDCDYRIMVARRGRRPNVDVWPFDLRDPIPEIAIPLAGDDPDVWLDLKPILDAVYDGGAYRYRLYDHPPDPPLTAEDAAWAAELATTG